MKERLLGERNCRLQVCSLIRAHICKDDTDTRCLMKAHIHAGQTFRAYVKKK